MKRAIRIVSALATLSAFALLVVFAGTYGTRWLLLAGAIAFLALSVAIGDA